MIDYAHATSLGLAGRFSPTLTAFSYQGVPGSIEMTTDANRVINGSLETDAYGDLETATGNLQWGQTPYRYIGGLNCQSEGLAYFGGGTGEGNSYRLIMMGERWYDPQVGRFISRDPVFSENLYAYCGNDPVNAVDPEGREPWEPGTRDYIKTMIFTGNKLKAYDQNGNCIAMIEAYSGSPGFTMQRFKEPGGPLPPGYYTVDPSAVQQYVPDPFLSSVSTSYYAEDLTGWGNFRVELIPHELVNTYDRSGFYIHGGDNIGSHGCIDIGHNDKVFIGGWIADQTQIIDVRVIYPPNVGPVPKGGKPW